jgi:uncharacterized protein YjlB
MPENIDVETYRFADDGLVPNNSLPVVLYRAALFGEAGRAIAARFAAHHWPGAWTNGIYGHHHYHASAHEVLAIAAGWAHVRLGGESGRTVELRAGDVVVIPAGVAHKREAASPDLLVIGAYPAGQRPDLRAAGATLHQGAAEAVAAVPLPDADPVTGHAAPLLDCWQRRGADFGTGISDILLKFVID